MKYYTLSLWQPPYGGNFNKIKLNTMSLKNCHLLTEFGNKSEAEIMSEHNKCRGELEAHISMKRNPKIIIINTPEEIMMENEVEAVATQNEKLENGKEVMRPIRELMIKKLIIEISSEQRTMILRKKIKLGWSMCNWEDYIMVTHFYKCSKFNHHAQDCKGSQTRPNCNVTHINLLNATR